MSHKAEFKAGLICLEAITFFKFSFLGFTLNHILQGFESQSSGSRLYSEVLTAYCKDNAVQVNNLLVDSDLEPIVVAMERKLSLLEANCGIDANRPDQPDLDNISNRILNLQRTHPATQSILYDVLNHLPEMYQLASSPRIIEVVKQLLGTESIAIHPRLIVLMSMPQETWHLASWHQDWYYNKGPESTVTLYAPLQYTSAENGSLTLALSEANKGSLDHGDFCDGHKSKWHHLHPSNVSNFQRVVGTKLNRGDVLFFPSLTPHRPEINKTKHIRFVINLRFRDLTDKNFIESGWRIEDLSAPRIALARKQESL